ncbi:glycosyltransferase family 2 protein [Calothrix sp. PCC 7507]|uniref:glycosyltransferase family 2 protein n=1 Tax=Calothrix sp. PCC 7507 TaxID=99598 RepID=UPI00029EC7E7|nr:glycosyltransferase family 2 protein [Calothrix sp. PCC 7507]AFY34216.1 glycosyl transferase family 2 [Calothrix sp. PCC 7507]
MLENITPLILTYNEAPNIKRTLQHLIWAKHIIVIDSYSTDETLDILLSYPQIKLFKRKFDTHTTQWNYGLQQVNSEWVLSLDADYIVSDELITEINKLPQESKINGYFARFKYCIFGKPLRGTLLPPRQVLFRKDKSIYIDDGHTQRLQLQGKSAMLSGYIFHDDRKPVSRWFSSEIKYSVLEAKKLLETPIAQLSFVERVRYTKVLAPFLVLIYCLILKGGILDGWHGWYYAFQRTLSEILLAINLMHSEFTNKHKN